MTLDSRLKRMVADTPARQQEAIVACRLLMRTATLLERHIDQALAPFAMHMREYLALRLLSDSVHEPLRPSDLSVSLDATRTQITRLLDALERRGLLVRSHDAQDRRSLQLALTPAGAQLLERCAATVRQAYLAAWAGVDAPTMRQVQEQLRQVYGGLKEALKGEEGP